MNRSVDISLGTADRCCPSSPSPFPLTRETALPPCLGFPASPSSLSGALPTFLSATAETRPETRADNFALRSQASTFIENANRTLSVGPSHDFKLSDPTRPRYSSSTLPDGNIPATLPPPYITLPPPSIPHPPQTLLFASTKPLLPLPPPLHHPTEDLWRMRSSQPASGGPITASSNSSQSPNGWPSFGSQGRRNIVQETTPSRPRMARSRRSSQASAHPGAGSVEGSTMRSPNPAPVKIEPAPIPSTATAGGDTSTSPSAAPQAPIKSRRVRTGCLTCRERHLKCDEGIPDCLNCRKGSRECKRGLRLNFIDIQIKEIPSVPLASEWNGEFTSRLAIS